MAKTTLTSAMKKSPFLFSESGSAQKGSSQPWEPLLKVWAMSGGVPFGAVFLLFMSAVGLLIAG
jgi:hypothetical protein